MRKTLLLFLFVLASALAGCGGRGGNRGSADTTDILAGLDTIYAPQYAAGFTIFSHGNSSILSVRNPWQGANGVQINMFISHNGELPPAGFDGITIAAPLRKVVCMSSSYIAFIDMLGELDAICGVSGARYISNTDIAHRYAIGEVRDVGHDTHMNYEVLAALDPDVVFVYGVAGENKQVTRKMDEMGIPHFYIGEYVEQSPLGKAEWLVAFGEMFGRRGQATERFGRIADEYNRVHKLVVDYYNFAEKLASSHGRKNTIVRPGVMLNAPYRDSWFVPGDRSYMVQLIGDAGGRYVCAGEDSDQSRPISGESAYIYAASADVWINPGQVASMQELKGLNPRFADIPSVRNRRVYNNNRRTTPGGGSDFWETGAVRPDIVLKDMVKVFRPEVLPNHELYYFQHLQ